MIVLSLFDGISAGRVALERAGINVTTYYRSEIDKYATQVASHHYPNDVQLGDVTKWREWDIDWSTIDLLIGGSPCQGFSFAGKQLAFDDPRSKLFFVFHEILYHVFTANPRLKYFLENVKMKKEHLDVITHHLGVQPVLINSALVSAQNRQRYYWYNWSADMPSDKGIVLRDIIDPSPYFYLRPCTRVKDGNSGNIAEATDIKGMDCIKRVYGDNGKSPTLTTMTVGHRQPKVAVALPAPCDHIKRVNDNHRVEAISEDDRGYRPHRLDASKSGISELGRVCKPTAKTDTLTTSHSPKLAVNSNKSDLMYRKLSPLECERLQTFSDNYTAMVSSTQRYKALGNSWTVDVISHIFSYLRQ